MATFTWSTGTSGIWSTPANWTGAVVPTSGSDVSIGTTSQGSASAVTENTSITINSLTMAGNNGGGGTRKTTLAVTPGATLTVGNITFDANSIINGTGTLIANGSISGGGVITASSGLLDFTGTGSIASGGAILNIGTAVASTLEIDLAGGVTSAAAISINNKNQTLEIGPSGSLTIGAAESITNGTIQLAGGTLTDITGAGVTIGSGATLTGKGTAGTLILSDGTITQTGGPLTLTSVTGSGTVNGAPSVGTFTASNGTLDLTGTISGAILAIATTNPSDLKIDGTATSTAAIALISNVNQTLEVGAAGALTINQAETVAVGKILMSGGTLGDSSGIVLGRLATAGTLIGFGTVSAGITKGGSSTNNLIEASGGRLILGAALGASSGLAYEIAGTTASVMQLGAAAGTGNTFTFLGTAGDLALSNAATFNETIVGLNVGTNATPTNFVDILNVAGVTVTSGGTGSGNGGTVTMSDGATLKLSSIADASGAWFVNTASDGAGGTDVFLSTVCYAAGTHILTATGNRMVESLMQGDIVLTLAGGELVAQPVRWIGQRQIDLTAHPHPETVAPIRIRRGAFADNMPHSDLLLSPDHAVFVDGKLICARQLVNGTTIRQEKDWASVEYFHVELDAHAILLAEGMPAESYLNTGNRGFFANSGEPLVLYPDLTDETDDTARAAGSCAPFVWDEAGVLPVWQRLAERAAVLGQPAPKLDTTGDPELQIIAKGRTVRPLYCENGLYVFVLPKGATEARLISRAGSPAICARGWTIAAASG
jgi:collagen type I/II/III/V/XI/XXIV/XXVII alpha